MEAWDQLKQMFRFLWNKFDMEYLDDNFDNFGGLHSTFDNTGLDEEDFDEENGLLLEVAIFPDEENEDLLMLWTTAMGRITEEDQAM